MDLGSLPDEMLANVFKYMNFETISTVRKINHRMDNIAKTFNIGTRLPVKNIWLYGFSYRSTMKNKKFTWEFQFDIDQETLEYIKYRPKQEQVYPSFKFATEFNVYLSIIDEILPHLQLNGSLVIAHFFPLDDKLLECFKENQANLRYVYNSGESHLATNPVSDKIKTKFFLAQVKYD